MAAVLLYHGGVTWAKGGFLGVEVFFVLSGFLITSLLLAEWGRSAAISLGAFWARRARRLLPALFCLVAVIGLYYAVAGSSKAIPGLKGDGISALIYYSNWHQIAAGSSYFAATGPVSPLEHTWSLAIEEQFYLVWPIVARRGAVARLARRAAPGTAAEPSARGAFRRDRRGRGRLGLDTALLFDGGRNLDRVYYGTDTRAASLLIGASLAIGMAIWRARSVGRNRRDRLPAPEARASGCRGPKWGPSGCRRRARPGARGRRRRDVRARRRPRRDRARGGADAWLYPYGLLGLDGAVVLLIVAAVAFPASLAARSLAVRPLRALGKISYGLYLWHFPLFLWLSADAIGVSGTELLLVRLAVTLAVSTASYFLIEQPIRQRRRPTWVVRALAPLAAGGAVAALLLASAAGPAPGRHPRRSDPAAAAGAAPRPRSVVHGDAQGHPDCRCGAGARWQGDQVRLQRAR